MKSVKKIMSNEIINENLYDMIFKRKSFHFFKDSKEKISTQELADIKLAYNTFKPLQLNINTKIKIVPSKDTNCKRGEEYCILIYSEIKENYLQNIGFIGEQLDLYLVSKNIGTLWYGIGKVSEQFFEGLKFVIMIAIAKISDNCEFRKDMFKSKRKTVYEIWNGEQIPGVSNIVRFAPSACNLQPWYVEHENNILKIFRYIKPGKRGIMPAQKVVYYNQIDIGIFICFLDLCLKHLQIDFKFELKKACEIESEKTLTAIYLLNNN